MIKALWLERRAVVEMKKQRMAMERIATCLEELLLGQTKTTGTSLRSLYKGEADGEVLMQSDEDLAVMEMLEKEKERVGGEVGIDEDLIGDYR